MLKRLFLEISYEDTPSLFALPVSCYSGRHLKVATEKDFPMTKILIAYASKSGTAQEAAEEIASRLPGSTLVDLSRQKPDLGEYDAVIIGSGVRVGAPLKDMKNFVTAHEDTLATMPAAYFITNCFIDEAEEILEKAIPENLRSKARFVGTIGGRLDIASLKGFDKAIAKVVSKASKDGKKIADRLDEEAISTLVTAFV